jgi:hypothetical protein
VKIYLAVRFASKYHPLRSKVEKGTFDTATGTYKQMLQLAGEWLRDPAKRCTMAAAMPHQAPVRGKHAAISSAVLGGEWQMRGSFEDWWLQTAVTQGIHGGLHAGP